MNQGYITLATGPREYLEMAVNLLLSIKLNDPARKTCVVIDEGSEFPREFGALVDHVVFIPPREGFHGCLNKLRLHELSPFDESMFVDADCILVKNDMDRHWNKFRVTGFSIAGEKVVQGGWYDFEVRDVMRIINIPYMVKMNSGVFYFSRCKETQKFFETAHGLVDRHKELLGRFHRNKLQLADEPFIGAALGMLRLDPIKYDPEEGSIMITTVNSSGADFNPIERVSKIIKNDDFLLLNRFLPQKRVMHSPTFAHFVKLRPLDIYQSCADKLRSKYKIPRYVFA